MKPKHYFALRMPPSWRRCLVLCAGECLRKPREIDLQKWVSQRLPSWRSRHEMLRATDGGWIAAFMILVLEVFRVCPDRVRAASLAVDMFGSLCWHKNLTSMERFDQVRQQIVPASWSADDLIAIQESFFHLFDVLLACDLIDAVGTESRSRVSRPKGLRPPKKPKLKTPQIPKQKQTVEQDIKRMDHSAERWNRHIRWALDHPLPGSAGAGKRR